ncbi:MAG: hypothetical protein ACLUKN_14630 [Bacilli bacterium]
MRPWGGYNYYKYFRVNVHSPGRLPHIGDLIEKLNLAGASVAREGANEAAAET